MTTQLNDAIKPRIAELARADQRSQKLLPPSKVGEAVTRPGASSVNSLGSAEAST